MLLHCGLHSLVTSLFGFSFNDKTLHWGSQVPLQVSAISSAHLGEVGNTCLLSPGNASFQKLNSFSSARNLKNHVAQSPFYTFGHCGPGQSSDSHPCVVWLTPSLCSGPCPELTSSQGLQEPAYLEYTKHPITLHILSLY